MLPEDNLKLSKFISALGYAFLVIGLARFSFFKDVVTYNKKAFMIRFGWNTFKERVYQFDNILSYTIDNKIIAINYNNVETHFDLSAFIEDDVLRFYGLIDLYTTSEIA